MIMIEATRRGADGSNLAAIGPAMSGGSVVASASTLPFTPSTSPCIEGPAERESRPVMFACDRPVAIAKNGTMK